MESDKWFQLGTLGFLLTITVILLQTFDKPDIVSIDSIRKSSCEELHLNYNYCLTHSNSIYWNYCNTLYLPIFYQKCI